MAIDSRKKRQNAAQVGMPLPVSLLPSGTIDATARYQISWSYGGDVAPPPAGVSIEDKIAMGTRQGTQQANVLIGGFG